MPQITFQMEESGELIVSALLGDNVLQLAQNAGVYIDAPCSGNGTCGKCRVKLVSGMVSEVRSSRISDDDFADGWKLACQASVVGDAAIFVPASAKAFMKGIRTADFASEQDLRSYERTVGELFEDFNPGTNLETIQVTITPPTLDDTTPDNERLITAIKKQLGISTVYMSNSALSMLPTALRENEFSVKCLIRKANSYISILDIRAPDDNSPLCGVAVDIGTTTVSAVLMNLETSEVIARASSGNNQIRYGADVINRIIQASKPGGCERLARSIREETLVPLIKEMCERGGVNPHRVCRAVIASNTTMNHLFAGTPASSIRLEPYVPVFRELPGVVASEFSLPIHPEARVVFAPNVGSYVGGDITTGTFVTGIWKSQNVSLFIDLGTNGELVVGNEDFLMCCACSAGPAFEGGDISCGMRATTGAIEACTIDKETMEPSFSIIGPENVRPTGLCGSGIIDVISELFRCGIINSRGKFCREGERILYNEFGASYVLSFADGEEHDNVELSEIDIDNFIRAKAAIYSAINTMLSAIDMTARDIAHVYIAGGIGSGISLEKAITIGMLPYLPLDKYSYIGNSSLTGACAMLLSRDIERQVYKIGRGMTYLELSSHPGYMDEFVAACFLPHTDASMFPDIRE